MEEIVVACQDHSIMEALTIQDHRHTQTMGKTKVLTHIIFKILEVQDTLKTMIWTPQRIIRITKDHLQSTDLERVAHMVSINLFQQSQAITFILNHQEQHHLVLVL